MASYPAGEEADSFNQIALMEMTLCIYGNTPPHGGCGGAPLLTSFSVLLCLTSPFHWWLHPSILLLPAAAVVVIRFSPRMRSLMEAAEMISSSPSGTNAAFVARRAPGKDPCDASKECLGSEMCRTSTLKAEAEVCLGNISSFPSAAEICKNPTSIHGRRMQQFTAVAWKRAGISTHSPQRRDTNHGANS